MVDLKAYAQIDMLSGIAKANGIVVPSQRGYRLMSEESTIDDVEKLSWARYRESKRNDEHFRKIYVREGFTANTVQDHRQIRGWARGLRKRFVKQMEMWNRYAGRDDVLMIHARCCREGLLYVQHEPWFLDACVDWFDPTYVDIYAKIKKE